MLPSKTQQGGIGSSTLENKSIEESFANRFSIIVFI